MRAKKKQPETVKEMVGALQGATNAMGDLAKSIGQLPADKFPEIDEEQQIVAGLDAVVS